MIKTSIDDNKKLTVEEYRTLVYGVQKNHSSMAIDKNGGGVKKSSSFTKFSSPSYTSSVTQDKDEYQKPLRYVRSKDHLKTVHSYNKSSDVKPSENSSSSVKK